MSDTVTLTDGAVLLGALIAFVSGVLASFIASELSYHRHRREQGISHVDTNHVE